MIAWRGKAPNGATVVIHDDMCAPKGSTQERSIAEEQRRIAHEILVRSADRDAEGQTG